MQPLLRFLLHLFKLIGDYFNYCDTITFDIVNAKSDHVFVP
jgi:hypothetical protein